MEDREIMNESTSKTVDKKSSHLWRCMNCNEMTNEYICTCCGKPSYKTAAREGSYKSGKTSESAVTYKNSAGTKSKNNADDIYKKELDSIADKLNVNVSHNKKIIRHIITLQVFLLMIVCTIFITKFYSLENKISNLSEKNQELISTLSEKDQELFDLISNQVEQTEEIKKPEEEYANSQIKYIVHTVERGETLLSICEKYNIEYGSDKNIISAMNGIENTNIIFPGQKIILLKFDNE